MPTKIPWTDETWNVVTGCTKKSPGCANCYALRMAWRLMHSDKPQVRAAYQGVAEKRRGNLSNKVHWTGRVNLLRERLGQPLAWKKPRRIFIPSMGDLFHDAVPDDFILKVWQQMFLARQHTFQVLTKRPARMLDFVTRLNNHPGPHYAELPNVWLGVSAENQATADERIPLLLQTPAVVRFVSCEPLLSPVNLETWLLPDDSHPSHGILTGDSLLDQVIVGSETGPGARPMHPDWARGLRDQCQAAGVSFFFKSWGVWLHASQLQDQPLLDVREHATGEYFWPDGSTSYRLSSKLAGHLLDGREWTEMPG